MSLGSAATGTGLDTESPGLLWSGLVPAGDILGGAPASDLKLKPSNEVGLQKLAQDTTVECPGCGVKERGAIMRTSRLHEKIRNTRNIDETSSILRMGKETKECRFGLMSGPLAGLRLQLIHQPVLHPLILIDEPRAREHSSRESPGFKSSCVDFPRLNEFIVLIGGVLLARKVPESAFNSSAPTQ